MKHTGICMYCAEEIKDTPDGWTHVKSNSLICHIPKFAVPVRQSRPGLSSQGVDKQGIRKPKT